jgi:hypothetical protein
MILAARHAVAHDATRALVPIEEATMQADMLSKRVDILERQMEGFDELPGRMTSLEAQVSQLRIEMGDMHAELIARMDAGDQETRTLMRVLHEDVIDRIARLGEQLNGRARAARSIPGNASSERLSRPRAKRSGAKKR